MQAHYISPLNGWKLGKQSPTGKYTVHVQILGALKVLRVPSLASVSLFCKGEIRPSFMEVTYNLLWLSNTNCIDNWNFECLHGTPDWFT